ncbi:MAG: hypothetical protein OXN89_05645 [Bryobacterales bacterium]|nr:hypothetical protein [Bryobacterales bacterium]
MKNCSGWSSRDAQAKSDYRSVPNDFATLQTEMQQRDNLTVRSVREENADEYWCSHFSRLRKQ